MKTIQIAILSKGRADRVHTLKQFPNDWRSVTTIYTPVGEYKTYKRANPNWTIEEIPIKKTIAWHRQYVMDNASSSTVLFMDDDLTFNRRRDSKQDTSLRVSTLEDMSAMMLDILAFIKKYAMVGISPRVGNNRNPGKIMENCRMYNCYAVDVKTFRSSGNSFAPADFPHEHMIMEDMFVNLFFITSGRPTVMLFDYAQGDRGANVKGGCSTWRTPEVQQKSIEWLASRFPGIVKPKWKARKNSWEGFEHIAGKNVRMDADILWKKAASIGLAKQKQSKGGISAFI